MTAIPFCPSSAAPRLAAEPSLTPFLKWPGGKSQELPAISAAAPDLLGRFVDPFVGGGSVLLAAPADVPAVVNDACQDLVAIYRAAASQEAAFREVISALAAAWDGLTERDGVFEDLADIFLHGSPIEAKSWLQRHRGDLTSLLAPTGPSLPDLFFAQAARDLPTKFERMRQQSASRRS